MFAHCFCFLNSIKIVIVIVPEVWKTNFIYTLYYSIAIFISSNMINNTGYRTVI
nr:MAG TPA: hypothetical protein [Caudoviricetes sp.]